MRKTFKIGLVIAVAAVLICVGFFVKGFQSKKQQDSASTTAKEFITKLTEGKPNVAYDLLTETSKKQQNKIEFASTMTNLRATKPDFIKPQVFAKSDAVYYFQKVNNLPRTKDGRSDGVFALTLVKEKGNWRVSSATVR